MNKQSLYIPGLLLLGLFSLGVLVGISIFDDSDNEQRIEITEPDTRPISKPSTEDSITPLPNPMVASNYSDTINDSAYSQVLEDKVSELEARIFELEQLVTSSPKVSTKAPPSRSESRFNQMNNLQTTTSLAKAGISEVIAADIIRRRNEIELKKLELHNRASREDYLDTDRYQSELLELTSDETTLREELGDDDYDFYLYINGQHNRVKVASVMMGSTAEQAGMKDGDLVINYGQHRVFDWNELKQATTEGVLGEYVNVDIVRDQQLISLSVPRGPLGVRLGVARVAP